MIGIFNNFTIDKCCKYQPLLIPISIYWQNWVIVPKEYKMNSRHVVWCTPEYVPLNRQNKHPTHKIKRHNIKLYCIMLTNWFFSARGCKKRTTAQCKIKNVSRDIRSAYSEKIRTSSEKEFVSMQVLNGTGQGVQRSERPLSESYRRLKVYI